jgi:geranylgeranyl diphosphate synthase type I
MTLQSFQAQLEPYLARFIQSKQALYQESISSKAVLELANYPTQLLAGGKRIRPYLVSLMYTGSQPIWSQLVGVELFHLFCLIHDDIIDHADFRHGTPTTHIWMAKQLTSQNAQDVGISQAILLGDLVLTWSREVFASTARGRSLPVQSIWTEMTENVIIGEMLDVHLTSQAQASLEEITEKTYTKTALYSFIHPLLLGAHLTTHISEEIITFCRDFGGAVGMAYQIQDDLLDVISTEEELKKPVMAESENHQHTLLTHYLHEQGISLPAPPEIYHTSGAVKHAQQAIAGYFAQAEQLLQTAPLTDTQKYELENLLQLMKNRTS